jgi:hypothetical protein
MIVASILRIAVLIERGGGNFVIPILMAFERLWSNTIISLFLFISCCFWFATEGHRLTVAVTIQLYQSGEEMKTITALYFFG